MKCGDPFVMNGQALPCGRCLACMINRRRVWAHRIMLEAKCHSAKSFLTLTYADENLPRTKDGQSWTLVPEHLTLFLKRLRRRLEYLQRSGGIPAEVQTKLRYFAVGEYGEREGKPHFHLATFGGSSCGYGQSRYSRVFDRCCWWCELCRETWGHGHIFNAELNDVTAAYVCGYVVKKMTCADDIRLKPGQFPEFARQSRRPGLGCGAMDEVASALLEHDLVEEDVPGALRHGENRIRPLGRYLRQQLRLRVGRPKEVPETVKEKMREEMQPLRTFAFDNSRSFAGVVKEVCEPETARLVALEEFRKKGKKL